MSDDTEIQVSEDEPGGLLLFVSEEANDDPVTLDAMMAVMNLIMGPLDGDE